MTTGADYVREQGLDRIVDISLELGCPHAGEFMDLYPQLSSGEYDWPCAVLLLPAVFDEYLAAHRDGA